MNPKTIKNLIAGLIWVFNTPIIMSYYYSFENGVILGLLLGGVIFAVLQFVSDQPFYNDWSNFAVWIGLVYAILIPLLIWLLT